MDLFEAIRARRSIRKFQVGHPVPDAVVERALEAAVLAPNSSNLQTWDFFWVKTPEKKKALSEACLSQAAARTASHLVVVVANHRKWKRANADMIRYAREIKAPSVVSFYYEKLVPVTYRPGPFNLTVPLKLLLANLTALFRPMTRGPFSHRALELVAVKSAALAAENFVLAVTAQGFQTCMMEGFDEPRVRRLLGLPRGARIAMVIGIGAPDGAGIWGPQRRLPTQEVIHVV